MEFQRRFFSAPRQSFFLFGPRRTGKSTWLRQAMPDALFVDLLQPDVARELAARPERLRDLVRGDPERSIAVIRSPTRPRAPELELGDSLSRSGIRRPCMVAYPTEELALADDVRGQ
jgi:hypothetical protein